MTDRYGHPRQSIHQNGRRHASAAAAVSFSTTTSSQHQPAPPPAPTKATRARRQPLGDAMLLEEGGEDDNQGSDDEHGSSNLHVVEGEGIVVRDANGEYALEEPPSMVVDDPDEVVLDLGQEREKERQRLADAVKQHQSKQNSVAAQPEELLEAVKASLRARVAALAEDKWMFEKEDELRPV